MTQNGEAKGVEEDRSAVYEDALRIVALLESSSAAPGPEAISEIKAACERIITDLPNEPYVEPEAFHVEPVDLTDWLITCPYCDNGVLLHGPTWVDGGSKEEGSRSTRICPYCGEEALVIDKRKQWQKKDKRLWMP